MKTRRAVIVAFLALLAAAHATAAPPPPAWVAKVPDFRSSWPSPLPIGEAAPEFRLEDLSSGRALALADARKGKKAVLLLFVDDSCGTAKRRAADLAETLARVSRTEGAAALVLFPRNLSGRGEKGMRAFAEAAKFPPVPLLRDDDGDRAAVTLAYRVHVTPCAAVLDAAGKLAYFGLALAPSGPDLLPGIVSAVAAGKPVETPAVRPPYG